MHLREMPARKPAGQMHQRGPQASMHVGDLAVDYAADEYIGVITNRSRGGEDFPSARMPPPTALDQFARDRIRER
jgi:hypothetical protein